VPLGYATVKTLLDDSVRGCKGDFAVYKPVRDPAYETELRANLMPSTLTLMAADVDCRCACDLRDDSVSHDVVSDAPYGNRRTPGLSSSLGLTPSAKAW
jgi:hypothetical protein